MTPLPDTFSVWSWTHTSTVHAYPTRHFTGTYADCDAWVSRRNCPEQFEICFSDKILQPI